MIVLSEVLEIVAMEYMNTDSSRSPKQRIRLPSLDDW